MDTPDFRVKTPALDPMAFANVLQRKAQIENEQRNVEQKRKDDRINNLMEAVKTGQTVASNMMTLAEKRRETQGLNDLTNLMSQPSPTTPEDTQTRHQAMMSALANANPTEFTKFASKSLFAPDKPAGIRLEPQDVMVDGVRTKAAFDKSSLTYYDVNTKKPVTGKVTPVIPANEDTEITAKDREELMPLAKQIADAKASGAAVLLSARGPRKEKLSRLVLEINPEADLSLYPQRAQLRREFTQGASSKAITAMNTATIHSEKLSQQVDSLDNSMFKKYNTVANIIKNESGNPAVKEFVSTRNLFADEVAKAARGGSGVITEEEVRRQLDSFDAANSPAQLKAVTDNMIHLMADKVGVLKSNWEKSMSGVDSPTPFTTKKTEQILKKHGIDPKTFESTAPSEQPMDALAKALGLKKKA